jgi:hypothetical protein
VRARLALPLILALALPAQADPREAFNEALRLDLTGSTTAVRRAFDLYRRAAEAGLPEAQFNVAAMLDSGRGVESDWPQAAIWYARAAARGNKRAAYNLGQLYQEGRGVPPNEDLARTWFRASGLPAARARLVSLKGRGGRPSSTLASPTPVAPVGDVVVTGNGAELVWTSPLQPEPVRFFLEVSDLSASGRTVFSAFTDRSSLEIAPPLPAGRYAWRVSAVAPKARRYAISDWAVLRIGPQQAQRD